MKVWMLLIFLFFGFSVFAQEEIVQEELAQNNSLSSKFHSNFLVSGGVNEKGKFIVGTTVQLIKIKNDFGFAVGFKASTYDAENYPKDYEASTNLFTNLISSKKKVKDQNQYYSIALLKNFYSKSKIVKYSVQLGPSINSHIFYDFVYSRRSSGYSFFGYPSNYDIYKKQKTEIGLAMESSIGFAIKNENYLEFCFFSNLNSFDNLIGGELKLVLQVF